MCRNTIIARKGWIIGWVHVMRPPSNPPLTHPPIFQSASCSWGPSQFNPFGWRTLAIIGPFYPTTKELLLLLVLLVGREIMTFITGSARMHLSTGATEELRRRIRPRTYYEDISSVFLSFLSSLSVCLNRAVFVFPFARYTHKMDMSSRQQWRDSLTFPWMPCAKSKRPTIC